MPGETLGERQPNILENQLSPGGSLGFCLGDVWFPGWNNAEQEKQEPAVTGGSVGNITFKCNDRHSHIFAVFGAEGDRCAKVGIPDPAILADRCLPRVKPGGQPPGASPPGPLVDAWWARFPPGIYQVARRSAPRKTPAQCLAITQVQP